MINDFANAGASDGRPALILFTGLTETPQLAAPPKQEHARFESQAAVSGRGRLSSAICLTAARLLMRLGLWLSLRALRENGAGVRRSGMRMLCAFGVRALSGTAGVLGRSLFLLRKMGA